MRVFCAFLCVFRGCYIEDVRFYVGDELFNATHDYVFVTVFFNVGLKHLLRWRLSAGSCFELDAQPMILIVRMQKQYIGNTGGHSFAFHYCRFGFIACAAVTDCKEHRAQIRILQREPFHARFLYIRFDVSHDDVRALKRWVVRVILRLFRVRLR